MITKANIFACDVYLNLDIANEKKIHEIQNFAINYETAAGAVGTFRARATTIIAVISWEVWRNRTGGAPIIDFTAEMRREPGFYLNGTEEKVVWERLDPHHIAHNARQLEVYHLKPNTTYQFRIWATNEVGAGDMYTISARTVEPTQEKG